MAEKLDEKTNNPPAVGTSSTKAAEEVAAPVAPAEAPAKPATQGSPNAASGAVTAPPPPSPVQLAIAQIEGSAAKGRKELWWFSLNGWKGYLPEIETAADNCVKDLLNSRLSQACEAQKKELLEVVQGRREKLALATGITDQIIGICQSLLAFGAGGLALSLAFIDKASTLSVPVQKYLAIAGIFYVELVIVSVLALILYMIQARFRYPSVYFEKIGNAWPWFYYASVSDDVPRAPIQPAKMRLKASELYATDFIKFTKEVVEEDYPRRLRAEIQQYFLLMTFQGYVNQFSLRLANLFMYGFAGAFMSMLIMLALVSFFGF